MYILESFPFGFDIFCHFANGPLSLSLFAIFGVSPTPSFQGSISPTYLQAGLCVKIPKAQKDNQV